VSDTSNHTLRRLTTLGETTTVAGQPGVYGTSDGTGGDARLQLPQGLAVDGAGNVYVADRFN